MEAQFCVVIQFCIFFVWFCVEVLCGSTVLQFCGSVVLRGSTVLCGSTVLHGTRVFCGSVVLRGRQFCVVVQFCMWKCSFAWKHSFVW